MTTNLISIRKAVQKMREKLTRTPSKQLFRRMSEAADLRANGIGWIAVARTLKCRPETCQAWPRRFPVIWNRLYAEAARATTRQAEAEALCTLRLLMRSKDPKVALAAC